MACDRARMTTWAGAGRPVSVGTVFVSAIPHHSAIPTGNGSLALLRPPLGDPGVRATLGHRHVIMAGIEVPLTDPKAFVLAAATFLTGPSFS